MKKLKLNSKIKKKLENYLLKEKEKKQILGGAICRTTNCDADVNGYIKP